MNLKVKSIWREWKGTMIFIIAMVLFRGAIADYMYVPSGSMNPTIIEGDRVFVHKIDLGLRIPMTTTWITHGRDPKRGDIAIFFSPKNGMTLIKRVIGLPGDVISMENERLTINGTALDYQLVDGEKLTLPLVMQVQPHEVYQEQLGSVSHPIMVLPLIDAMRNLKPIIIPPGQYFMMGDNRDNSRDSRYIGTVPRKNIIGIANSVVFSLNNDHHYFPRTDRFAIALH